MTRSLALATLAALLFAAPVASAKKTKKPQAQTLTAEEGGDLYAVMKTSMGDITIRLFEKEAPKTVENFVGLATGKKEWKNPKTDKWETGRPLYDSTAFHRVIPNFMIQGGDPLSSSIDGIADQAGRGNPGYRFEDETTNGKTFDKVGLLAMANSGPNTNGSQFFITESTPHYLDGKHTIFGEVVQGYDLVPKIARAGNMAVKLEKVTIVRGKMK